MAKKNKPFVPPPPVVRKNGHHKDPGTDSLFFVTSAGRVVHYVPVSTVVLELIVQGITQTYRERGEPIDVPTYQVEAVGGVMQTFEHNETTLVTDEHKKAWAAYKEANFRMEQEINTRRTEACLLCIQENPHEDLNWMPRQLRLGIKIPENTPDNPDALFLHYVKTVVLTTASDIVSAVGEIVAAGMRGVISPEQIEAAKKSFRGVVEDIDRELNTSGEPGADQGSVEK